MWHTFFWCARTSLLIGHCMVCRGSKAFISFERPNLQSAGVLFMVETKEEEEEEEESKVLWTNNCHVKIKQHFRRTTHMEEIERLFSHFYGSYLG